MDQEIVEKSFNCPIYDDLAIEAVKLAMKFLAI